MTTIGKQRKHGLLAKTRQCLKIIEKQNEPEAFLKLQDLIQNQKKMLHYSGSYQESLGYDPGENTLNSIKQFSDGSFINKKSYLQQKSMNTSNDSGKSPELTKFNTDTDELKIGKQTSFPDQVSESEVKLKLDYSEHAGFYQESEAEMLGTINEVVMSEMYDATSMSDIGKQSGSFSSSSDSEDIMSKLNSKLLKMKGEIKTADNHMVKKISKRQKKNQIHIGPRALKDFQSNDQKSNLSSTMKEAKNEKDMSCISLSASSSSSESLNSSMHIAKSKNVENVIAQKKKSIEKSKFSPENNGVQLQDESSSSSVPIKLTNLLKPLQIKQNLQTEFSFRQKPGDGQSSHQSQKKTSDKINSMSKFVGQKEIIEEEEKGINCEVATPLISDIPALRKIKTFSESKDSAATSDFAQKKVDQVLIASQFKNPGSLLTFQFQGKVANGEKTPKVFSNDDTTIGLRKDIQIRKPPRKRESTVVSTTNLKKFKADGNKMINQYVVEKTLGKGSFATVLLCSDSETNQKYAIKQMNKKTLSKKQCGGGKNALDCVIEELKVLKSLEHPNIIWLYEIIDDPKKDSIYLVQEWYTKGSLGDKVIEKNKNKPLDQKVGLPLNQVRLYLVDMLKALHYCHKIAKVIHRDIKPDNIMLNHNEEAVLIDFGVSAIVEGHADDTLYSNMGSYMFFAPEMFMRQDKSIKVRGEQTDIWALGITFYYLLTGVYPCEDAQSPLHLKELILNREINFDLIKNSGARCLIKKILQKDPQKRASLEDIQQDDWLTQKSGSKVQINEVEFYRDEDQGFGNIERLMKLKQAGTINNLLIGPRKFDLGQPKDPKGGKSFKYSVTSPEP